MDRLVLGVLFHAFVAWAAWRLAGSERHRWFLRPPASQFGWTLLVLPLVGFNIAAFWGFWWFIGQLSPAALESVLTWWTDDGTGGRWRTAETWLFGLLIGPAVEEMLFRGALLPRWARTVGWGKALFLQASLFAILHGNPLGSMAFALLAGLLYLQTCNLWAPILLHTFHNSVAVLPWRVTTLWDAPSTAVMEAFRSDFRIALVMLVLSTPPLLLAAYTLWGRGRGRWVGPASPPAYRSAGTGGWPGRSS